MYLQYDYVNAVVSRRLFTKELLLVIDTYWRSDIEHGIVRFGFEIAFFLLGLQCNFHVANNGC